MTPRAIASIFDQRDPHTTEPAEFAVQSNSRPISPTLQVSAEWQFNYSEFNERLFGNVLPDCVITFTKMPGVYGYFCVGAFRDRKGVVAHEIAMNPRYFAKGDMESFATLVHEMCHMWRHLFGPRNRKGGLGATGYHDVVWAEKMEAIGLMPSNTGKPGGRRTGFQMLDYPIEGGAFDLACRELLIRGHTVNWRDGRELSWGAAFGDAENSSAGHHAPTGKPRRGNTRARFVCPDCDLHAWSRPSAQLSCLNCNTPLVRRESARQRGVSL